MKIAKIMLGLVPVIGLMSVEASATPLPRMESGAPANAAAPIEKVHGWHRYCAWGPGRYHRHVPGVGNVRCGGPRYGFYGPRVHTWGYVGPRHHAWRSYGHHRGHHWR